MECQPVYLRQLILRKPYIFIGKTDRHTSYFVVVLVDDYFIVVHYKTLISFHILSIFRS